MTSLTGRLTTAMFLAGALFATPIARSLAQNPMPGMHHDMTGMNMKLPPVTIPHDAIYTEADVRFMQGMIAHHAQAIYMSRMAAAHGASPRLLKFAQKIDQSQQAEIRLMQGWLHANHQFATDTSSWRHMSMPGMLTAEQLTQLDGAKGKDFDELFLEFMIQHHEGALMMVKDLFATPLAAQDVDVSVFANDVQTVQTAEIGTMQRMLNNL
jgi:Uncharacterized protein conserved in bacteria